MATVTSYILIISVLCLALISPNCNSKSSQSTTKMGKKIKFGGKIKNNLLKMRKNLCRKSTTGQRPLPGVSPESALTAKFLINSMFPGLFQKNTIIESMMKAMRTKTNGSQRQSQRCTFNQNVVKRNDLQMKRSPRAAGDDDKDMCCRTRVFQFSNTTLVNVNGITRDVVQLSNEDMYQYIPHGFCAGKSLSCTGWCVQIYQLHFVLVIKPTGGVEFEAFSIPSYCSCKNIGC